MRAIGKTPAKSRWIPWSFVGFFVVVFAVNGVMLFFALSSWTGISTDDAFRKGLAYNDRLAAAEAQDRLGWRTELQFPETADLEGDILLVLSDRDGTPINGAEVRARLVRPTHEGFDREVSLSEQGHGRYAATLTLPLPGLWEARLHVAHQRGDFRISERFQAQP